jgi:hypothetical protein
MAKSKSTIESMKIGQELAAAALKSQRAADRSRNAALARIRRSSPQRLGSPSVQAVAQASAGTLVAEGDSWFDYPFHDVLSRLEDLYAYDVEAVSHRGDCVEEMAYGGGQLVDFTRRIAKVVRGGITPKAILLSGGGNDIAGDEFAILLNHAASGIRGLNESVLAGVIDQRLFDGYTTILAAVDTICLDLVKRKVPIIVHGYSYPVADGRGVLGGFGPLPGPWLETGFRSKGYTVAADRAAVMKQLIDRFNAMLKRLCKVPAFAHVTHVDLRATLSSQSDYKQWWANELHPTKKGFDAVAAKFAAAIG